MKRGNTLVGLLVTFAIIAVLAVVFLKGGNVFGSNSSPRKDGRGTTVPGLVKAKAEDEVCRSNLGQVRMSLQISRDANGDESWPESLQETRLGSQFYMCPMGKEPYRYDPATGKVSCPHPGHEKY